MWRKRREEDRKHNTQLKKQEKTEVLYLRQEIKRGNRNRNSVETRGRKGDRD